MATILFAALIDLGIFHKTVDLPIAPLKHCISIALTWRRRKKLPLLGAA